MSRMSISVQTALCKSRGIKSDDLLFYFLGAAFFSLPLGTSPPTIFGALAALVWVLSGKAFRQVSTCFGRSWSWPILALIAIPWVGLIYSPDLKGLGMVFAGKTHYWLYCMAVAAISFGMHRPGGLIKAFLAGLALNTFAALLQFAGLLEPVNGVQYHGFGLGYSTVSTYLVVGILMASYYFRAAKDKKQRLFPGILMAFYFFHLIILQGRVGFLTFFVLCPLIVRNLLHRPGIFKVSAIWLLLLGSMFISPVVRDRVSLSMEELEHHLNADPGSAWGREYSEKQDRFYMWHGAIQIFLENPVLGIGTGGYQIAMKQRGKPEWPVHAHPHNSFLYMAVSFGLVGVSLLLWFFWEITKNSWKERHSQAGFFVLSTALVIFVSGFVDTQIADSGTAFLLALAAGLQNGFPGSEHPRGQDIIRENLVN